jgi:hypothetical protein
LISGLNSATPDGLIIGLTRDALVKYGVPDIKSNCILLEIKSIDPRTNLTEEKSIHNGQTIQQMGLIRELTKWRPYYTIIVYVDASFLDNIKVFVVEWDAKKWAAAKKRSDMIFNTDDPKELTPEGKINDSCTYCKWQKACSIVQLGAIPADNRPQLEPEDEEIFIELISEAAKLAAEIKEKTEEHNALKQEIKDELVRLDRRWCEIKHDGKAYSTRWSKQKGRKSLDKDAVEAAGIDLEPFMVEGDGFEKFEVKVK